MAKGGLEDIIAGETAISIVDGAKSTLIYRGIRIEDLVEHACFEEVVYLLWYGRLPNRKELDDFRANIADFGKIPQEATDILRHLPPDPNPMSHLRTGVSLLGLVNPYENATNDPEMPKANELLMGQLHPGGPGFSKNHPNSRKAIRLLSRMVPLVAYIQRYHRNEPFLDPVAGKSFAFNFLRCLSGQDPDEDLVRIFDKCLILHADHGFNASTFTARVAASTLTDMHSAVVAAICSLKGPLHGGANTAVMKMLMEIRDPAKALDWVDKALADKRKIMGFGHRVYKNGDPRAKYLKEMAAYLVKKTKFEAFYEISSIIEKRIMEKKQLMPNVDFWSATVYYCLGIDPNMYTPIFALSRTSGWIAHIVEQLANNRLIRPEADYIGVRDVEFVPMDQRK